MEDKQAPGTATSMDALKAQYGEQYWWKWFEETASLNDEPVSIRHIAGPLRMDGDFILEEDPWAVIIDGDVEIKGTLICKTPEERLSTLVILGKLKAQHLFFSGSARLAIEDDTTLDGFVVGTWGDGGASLDVTGTLTARGVLLDPHTPAKASKQIDALIMCGEGWPTKPDFLDGDQPELFDPAVLERGGDFVDLHLVRQAAQAGRPVFNQEVEQARRQEKGLPV
ncbi:hypothetical protein [Chitinophaga filiformis]|uniref:Polymer-forming cytoskeletal protein n=1 Tax=Chitinophaga filiformis TaxID=104663 RepID=A0ABY4HXB7_CHIFI|nr:hypothetical protein [Chitinophaga filiformis]UPK68450.1 hypothetical protein MYF79_26195 [Chitinophaga filiformis]